MFFRNLRETQTLIAITIKAQLLACELSRFFHSLRNPLFFSFQTATDRFYPDFICKLEDGRVLAVAYKNSRDYDLPDSEEKRRLGALWEMRSNGKCLFIMPRGKDFEAIKAKLAG